MASSLAPSFKATAKVQVLVLVWVPRLVRPCPATAMARVRLAHKRDVDDMVTSGSPGGEGRGGLGPGNKDWIEKNPITGTAPHAKIHEPVKDFVNDAVEGVTETVRGVGEEQE